MTTLNTETVYVVDSEPTHFDGEPHPDFKIGDTVKVTHPVPDPDGDVTVSHTNGDPALRYRYLAAKCLRPAATVDDFPVGTRVKVAAEAKTVRGGDVFFDGEAEGVVVEPESHDPSGNVRVEAMGRRSRLLTQIVAPQFLTKLPELTVEDFAVGDRVKVAEDAKSVDGVGVYFGAEVDGVVVESDSYDPAGTVRVEAMSSRSGRRIGQHVAPEYLTKLPAKIEDFAIGDRVKVAEDAKTHSGGQVYWGREVEGVITETETFGESDVCVEAETLTTNGARSQIVSAAFLTKLPAETEPEAPETEDADEAGVEEGETVEVLTIAAVKAAVIALGITAEDAEKLVAVACAIEAGI